MAENLDSQYSERLDELRLEIATLQLQRLSKVDVSTSWQKLWNSPVGLAVLGAFTTALLALLTNFLQFKSTINQERHGLESSLILRAMEETTEEDRRATLLFLIACGLISDRDDRIKEQVERSVPRITPAVQTTTDSPHNLFVDGYEYGGVAVISEAERATRLEQLEAARKFCAEIGLTSTVAVTVIYDTIVHQERKRMHEFAKQSTELHRGNPRDGIAERDWLLSFLDAREKSFDQQSPSAIGITKRTKALREMVINETSSED